MKTASLLHNKESEPEIIRTKTSACMWWTWLCQQDRMDTQVTGDRLTPSVRESCSKGWLCQGIIPGSSCGSCLGGRVAPGVIPHPCPLFVGHLNGSGCAQIRTPAPLPLRLQVTVCNEVGEEDSTKDAVTQNTYYRMIKDEQLGDGV